MKEKLQVQSNVVSPKERDTTVQQEWMGRTETGKSGKVKILKQYSCLFD